MMEKYQERQALLNAKRIVKEQHIQNAMLRLDREFPTWEDYGSHAGKKYAVLSKANKEKRYPVKTLFVYAAHEADKKIPADVSWAGRIAPGDVEKVFKKLGFEIKDISNKNKSSEVDKEHKEETVAQFDKDIIKYGELVLKAKNVIFHGAPGTGKTYLAQRIAAYIASDKKKTYEDLIDDSVDDATKERNEEILSRIGFVQFHPSYDYSDFIEGLRPEFDSGEMNFKLREGVFKQFINTARKNYEDIQKSSEVLAKERRTRQQILNFLEDEDIFEKSFRIKTGNEFSIRDYDDKYITISIDRNDPKKDFDIGINDLARLLESKKEFKRPKDVTQFLRNKYNYRDDSYLLPLFLAIRNSGKSIPKRNTEPEKQKNFVFIIDEINRGEISKIFGELFFSIDPGYRGKKGAISTQYSYLQDDQENSGKNFYIPDNVYIIGTMNDIDRSVDSFDFAMRRRFRFVELKADNHKDMLKGLTDDKRKEAEDRMKDLNEAIANAKDLGDDYKIGASYFLKLGVLDADALWDDHLEPLLREYVRGNSEETELMDNFKNAYYKYGKGTNKESEGTR